MVTCEACGTEFAGAPKFCSECGSPIRPPAAPVAERRVCSVLFCDLVGFTTVSEGLDPEDVRELLSDYFVAARAVLTRFGGSIEKFIGDAVVAVWGTPVATVDDAARAVAAGLELIRVVSRLRLVGSDAGVQARIGIVTGEVAVTLGATGQGMVAGDPVNTAARVQSVAIPGHVWVDADTMRRAATQFRVTDAGRHVLKGKAEPVELFEVEGLVDARETTGSDVRTVGRRDELQLLRESLETSIRARRAASIVVTGPAGIGKSRLLRDFEQVVDASPVPVLWHLATCPPFGQGGPFAALAVVVRQRLGIGEGQIGDTRSRVSESVDRLFADDADRTAVARALWRLLGVVPEDVGNEPSQDELFVAWRRWLERLAVAAPVVVVLDAAEHADPALLAFVDHVHTWATQVSVCVVLARRADMSEPPLAVSGATAVELRPLDAKETEALIRSVLADARRETVDMLVARADGNPLFALELVRSLVNSGAVREDAGGLRQVRDVVRSDVPDSLQAVLAARLDALLPVLRDVVHAACVFAEPFTAEDVVVVASHVVGVTSVLDALVVADVLMLVEDPSRAVRLAYAFRSDLTRLVAYRRLSRRDRKARHLAVAGELRRANADDTGSATEAIAHHLDQALTSVPTDADVPALRAAAADAHRRAGGRARRLGALRRAAISYARAGELTAGVEAVSALTNAAWCLLESADFDSAINVATRAQDLAEAVGDRDAEGAAELVRARALYRGDRIDEALPHYRSAVRTLALSGGNAHIEAVGHLAHALLYRDRRAADEVLTEVEAVAVSSSVSATVRMRWLLERALIRSADGQVDLAIKGYSESLSLAESVGDVYMSGVAGLNLACELEGVDVHQAVRAGRAAVAALRRAGARQAMAYAVLNLTDCLLMAGDWDGAVELREESVVADGLGDVLEVRLAATWLEVLTGRPSPDGVVPLPAVADVEDVQIRNQLNLAAAFAAAVVGRDRAAFEHARAVLDTVDRTGSNYTGYRFAWSLSARIAQRLGDDETVTRLLDDIDRLGPDQTVPMLLAERDLVLARRQPDGVGGGPSLASAVESLAVNSSPMHLALGQLDLARHLAPTRPDDARALVEQATATGRRLGAALLLHECEDVARELAGRGRGESPVVSAS